MSANHSLRQRSRHEQTDLALLPLPPPSPHCRDDTEDDVHQCFSAGGSGPKDGRRKLRQEVTAQRDHVILNNGEGRGGEGGVCALEMNFGSWWS